MEILFKFMLLAILLMSFSLPAVGPISDSEKLQEYLLLGENLVSYRTLLAEKIEIMGRFELDGAHSGDAYKYTYANLQDDAANLRASILEDEARRAVLKKQLASSFQQLLEPFEKLQGTERRLAESKKKQGQLQKEIDGDKAQILNNRENLGVMESLRANTALRKKIAANRRLLAKEKKKIKQLEMNKTEEIHHLYTRIAVMDSLGTNLKIIKNLNSELYHYLNLDFCRQGTSLSEMGEKEENGLQLQGYLLATLNSEQGVLRLIQISPGVWEGEFASEQFVFRAYKVRISGAQTTSNSTWSAQVEITDWSGIKSGQTAQISRGPSGILINSFGKSFGLSATRLN